MSKKQSRRSVSISKCLHEALGPFAESQGRAVSDIVENEMRKLVGLEPRAVRKPAKHRSKDIDVNKPKIPWVSSTLPVRELRSNFYIKDMAVTEVKA